MKKIEVLVADGHTILREGLKRIVSNTPDIVVSGEAADGDELLMQVGRREHGVVVTDIAMRGPGGLDLIRRIKALKPALPILILSAHSETKYASRSLRAGASGYLTKESDSGLLLAVIRKLAAGGVYVSATVAAHMVCDRTESERDLHDLLSRREYQIFTLINAGHEPRKIADLLGVSAKTVSTLKTRLMEKLRITNTAEIVRYAVAHDLTMSDGRFPPMAAVAAAE